MTCHIHLHFVLPPDSGGEPFELIPTPIPPEPDWDRLVGLSHGDKTQARRLTCHEQRQNPSLAWDQAVTRALHRWLHELAR
jgi:hypothetical protein